MTDQALGSWLAEMCQKEGLSLRQAAAKTGLSHDTIRHIINGGSVSSESIRKLARAFGGDGNERLALEDTLLVLAGHRTRRPKEQKLSQLLLVSLRLINMVSRFNEPQLKLMEHFAEFLAEIEIVSLSPRQARCRSEPKK